jgi:hypothetical protein
LQDNTLFSKARDGSYLLAEWVAVLQAMLRAVTVPDVEFVVGLSDRPTMFKHNYYPLMHYVKVCASATAR